jgi:hypothetical protein
MGYPSLPNLSVCVQACSFDTCIAASEASEKKVPRSWERNTSTQEVPLAFGHVPGPIPAENTEGPEISRAKEGCLKKPDGYLDATAGQSLAQVMVLETSGLRLMSQHQRFMSELHAFCMHCMNLVYACCPCMMVQTSGFSFPLLGPGSGQCRPAFTQQVPGGRDRIDWFRSGVSAPLY